MKKIYLQLVLTALSVVSIAQNINLQEDTTTNLYDSRQGSCAMSDIDNDGDVDSSDKFLHKKRKAISKAMNKEEVQEETLAMKAAKHIASMWEDSAKAKEAKVKEEEEETPKKKESKAAMTGKPMAGVEVNPKESKDK